MVRKRRVLARVPVALECVDAMKGAVSEVLGGEYDSGYFGDGLTVLDIGANVGAFSIWANMCWPHSTIHAYEPNPDTFQTLVRNVASLPNVVCHQQAVYPGDDTAKPFYSRYDGDGEAGLVDYIDKTFAELPTQNTRVVPTIDPKNLPKCDVLKIDAEGAEASIIENMELTGVSLILLEYQTLETRSAIEEVLKTDFTREFEDSFPWSRLLPGSDYRKDLAGNRYGHLFFVHKRANKLRRLTDDHSPHSPSAWDADHLPLTSLVKALPGATLRALKRRLR